MDLPCVSEILRSLEAVRMKILRAVRYIKEEPHANILRMKSLQILKPYESRSQTAGK